MQHISSLRRTNWHSGRRCALERRALCFERRAASAPNRSYSVSVTSNARCSRPRISFQAGNPRGPLCASQNGLPSPCCNSIHARLPASRTQTRRLGCPFLIRSSPPADLPLGDTGRALTSLSRRLWLGCIVPCFPCSGPGPAGPCLHAPASPGVRHAPRLLQPGPVQSQLESLASSLQGGRLGVEASVQRAAAARDRSQAPALGQLEGPAFTRMFASAPALRPIPLTAASRRRFSKTLRAAR
jgi:hypothetical protein